MAELKDKKLLIGLGVEKCGTTSLFSLLEKVPGFAMPTRKETRFFAADYEKGFDHYTNLFPDHEKDDWLVDISPAYFREEAIYERIRSAGAADTVVIFLMRNPVRRAFSQYWHDIFNHVTFGENGWGEQFRNFSFEALCQAQNKYYFTPYAEAIKNIKHSFGDRAIFGIFEEFIENPSSLLQEISEKTGRNIPQRLSLPRENKSSFARLEITPKGSLRRVGAHRNETLRVSKRKAINLLAMQGTFTHVVSRQDCERIYAESFKEDIKACEDLLSRKLEDVWQQTPLTSPMKPVLLDP